MIYIFSLLILRILDVHSTYLCADKYGAGVEGNGIPRFLMEHAGITNYLMANLIASSVLLGIAWFLWNKSWIVRWVVKIMTFICLVVVVSNYLCYLRY